MKHLKRDVFRLAGTYLIIIMVMSIGFSAVFYQTSTREFDRRPPGGNGPHTQLAGDQTLQAYLEEREVMARQSLFVDLLILNLIALIIGSLLSYILAQRTLQPIEENMEAQSQFVSDASHELRTPLTALRAANEVALRDKRLKLADARQVIADNVDDIARLQDLTDSMLGLLKEDDASTMRQSVSLELVVGDAVNMVATQAIAKDIAVDDQTTPLTFMGSEQQLTQLLTILLDNAIKYSNHGTSIHLSSRIKGKLGYLIVRDEGVGIDKRSLEQIFTRFYRAEKSRTTTGYGLGLSIAKRIVDTHGGTISATSEPGRGTTFTIALPIVRS